MAPVAVTAEQRDVLLHAIDKDVDDFDSFTSDGEPCSHDMEVISTIARSLLLPNADGGYTIAGVSRERLVTYLKRELGFAEWALADPHVLRIHYACTGLLAALGETDDDAVTAGLFGGA